MRITLASAAQKSGAIWSVAENRVAFVCPLDAFVRLFIDVSQIFFHGKFNITYIPTPNNNIPENRRKYKFQR